jgi:ABC-type transport system substrate-binding protein/DNA-binding SARP family transcriptional activator
VSEPLEFRILGPFEARREGRALELPAGKSRGLLALLLLHRNEVVSVDTLVDGLWGERPPATAAKNVQVYVSHLRKTIGDGSLLTRAPGYLLRLEPGQLDADRFQALLEEARGQQPAQAAERLRAALALWRGEPLADFRYDSFAQEEIRRLEELHLAALEERIESELALGRHEDVLSELKSLARANPLRERLQGQLMLALYRCGRQTEALEAYRADRRRLVEELGLEPSPELQRLERAILAHDPSLAAPARVPPPDGGAAAKARSLIGRRDRLLVAAGVVVLAAVAVLAALRLSRGSGTLTALPNSIGVIDARHNSLSDVIAAGGVPGGIAYGEGGAWVTDTPDDVVLRVDPAGEKIDRVPVGHGPTGVAVGGGEVWVVNELDRTVSEVNPRALREVKKIPVGLGARAIAYGAGSVWVANGTDSTITRINPNRGQVVARIPLAGAPAGIAVGRAGVWVTSASTGQLLLLNPNTNQVSQPYPIGNGPQGVAVGAGSVWVANEPDGSVSRFYPGSGQVSNKIPVGRSPLDVAFGNGSVWVTNGVDGTVSRIDPKTNATTVVRVGNEPTALAIAGKDVWTTVLPSRANHRGGTLRVVRNLPVLRDSTDPAAWHGSFASWQMLSLTNDGLVSYRRVGGLAGDSLVRDLATALPVPTDGGRTYTFQLQRGIHYSNGLLVQPEDFRRAIERTFELERGYSLFYTGIVGADHCRPRRPRRCDLSRGIVSSRTARTVTFHLTRPDPDFLYKLAFPMAYAVPPGTPHHDIGGNPLPATGPYMTRRFSPSRSWVLVRNPRFREWSRDAQPDGYPSRIDLKSVHDLRAAVGAIKRGESDVLLFPPSDRLAGLGALGELATRYANQLHSDPYGLTTAFVMNTRVPPFNHVAVRRALNYAIDRGRIVRYVGGTLAAQPTCQILPPTVRGYRPYCPYTLNPTSSGTWTAPDRAKAEELVRSSGTRGMKVTVWTNRNYQSRQAAPYLVRLLHELGYRASLKRRSDPPYFKELADSRNRIQIGWFGYFQDYPTPSDFIDLLLSCKAFTPRDVNNFNLAEFCDKSIEAQIRRAYSLEASDPAAANELWSRIDRQLVDQAPWVPLYNERALTALSNRVGNYRYHPFWNVVLDQLWVR